MDSSRRSFLAAALAGVVGVAGCSDDAGVSYPDDDATNTTGTTTASATTTTADTTTTTGEQTTETTEEQTTTTPPAPALAQETAAIVDEIQWFASSYPHVLERYLSRCDQAIATIQQVKRSSTLTEPQLQKVRDASNRAAAYFDRNLEPHFDVYGPVPGPHLEEISTFAKRGDIDRAHAELEELLGHFQDVSSTLFVQRELSRDPIHDTLYNRLATNRAGRALFGFIEHTSSWKGWAYPTTPENYSQYTWNAVNADTRREMGPVMFPDERADVVSITVNEVLSTLRWEKDSLPSVPVLVQRYASRDAARRAYDAVVDSTVTVESQTTFGRATWDAGYYYYNGDITYAYLLQVGSFLLSMAPSTTPWNERPPTEQRVLERSWLWQ